jgi:hypothetical protein
VGLGMMMHGSCFGVGCKGKRISGTMYNTVSGTIPYPRYRGTDHPGAVGMAPTTRNFAPSFCPHPCNLGSEGPMLSEAPCLGLRLDET